MGKRLTVILGAGASCDSVSIPVSATNNKYKPPLTNRIFEGRPEFQSILDRYPKARALASTIAVRINQGVPLEAMLRTFRDSKEEHEVRGFMQIPLYLQELFGEISINYTSEPVNYGYLVNRLMRSDMDEVAFVTLNYDLLLEKSLAEIHFGPKQKWWPSQFRFYLERGRKWFLVKLHGSVNWGRRMTVRPPDHSHQGLLACVDQFALKLDEVLDPEIHLVQSHQKRWGGSAFFYPAISVPVEGKYQFVCPPDHVDALRSFLRSCQNFLIIGISGRDEDLVDLLKENITDCAAVGIVEGSPNAAEEVARRFEHLVPQFRKAKERKKYMEGFSGFTTAIGRSLEDFLTVLK
jgi:hypothetical protein